MPKIVRVVSKNGYREKKTPTRVREAVFLQLVTLEKPLVTHGTSVWLHP